MKFLIRFCSLFSCFALLFAVFCSPVSAVDINSTKKAHILLACETAGRVFGEIDVLEGESGYLSGETEHELGYALHIKTDLTMSNVDGSILMPKGSKYNLLLENLHFEFEIIEHNGTTHRGSFANPYGWIEYYFVYADGSYSGSSIMEFYDPNVIVNDQKGTVAVSLPIDEEKDILKVHFAFRIFPSDFLNFTSNYGTIFLDSGFRYPMKFSISTEDESVGLLEGLLAWVKDIWGKVGDTLEVVSTGFSNIGSWIAELPMRIWDAMESGIKGLFVPDNEYMTSYSDRWDSLLADRLGAVYQVCDIAVGSWDGIMNADQTDTINLPEVTIPLPDNNSFSFGGYDVQIVPEGFGALVTAVKTAIGILCTYLFVNGLLKRYEEVMGVEE